MLIDRICEVCGNGFQIKESDLKYGRGRYCSRPCYYASKTKRAHFTCAACAGPFERSAGRARGLPKYCSQQCAGVDKRKADAVKAHPLYEVWRGMRRRCLEAENHNYPRYGGRGIKICDRWLNSFADFARDMGPRPEGMSIDRIDNDGDYSPENCRWASVETQAGNRRTTVWVEHEGERMSLTAYARLRGVNSGSVHAYVSRGGMTPKEAADRLSLRAKRGFAHG